MTELTLALLKALRISPSDRTTHALANITRSALRLRYIQHDPIWGFRCLGEETIQEKWQGELQRATAGFAGVHVVDNFVASGGLTEGTRSVRASELTGAIRSLLRSAPAEPISSILPLDRLAGRGCYPALGDALDAGIVLPAADAAWPDAEKLHALLAQQERRFPSDICVVTAEKVGERVVARRAVVIPRGAPVGRDGAYCGEVSLARASGVRQTRVVVTQIDGDGGETELQRRSLDPGATAFTLRVTYTAPELLPKVASSRGALQPLPAEPLPAEGAELAALVKDGKPADVAFLLDGSMTEAEFAKARDFTLQTAEDLARTDTRMRFAYVLYAEYRTKRGSRERAPWSYEVRKQDFVGRAAFAEALGKEQAAGVVDDDPCDALELGLREVKGLSWKANSRFLVLIGNSPPHPRNEERVKRMLLDRETEQHLSIDWRVELAEIEKVVPRRMSIWIEPQPTLRSHTREWQDFGREVWRAIGQSKDRRAIDRCEPREVAAVIRACRGEESTVQTQIAYPLLQPLANVAAATA